MSRPDNDQFIEDAIRAMNEYRQLHQVEPLSHNPQLTAIAQRWTDHLANSGTLEHNPNATYKGEELGENCAMKWTSDHSDFTGKQCVNQWYSEIGKYDFQRNSGPGTGHFTQVVWKSSREVGIGRSQTANGKWFVCADFYPAGNYVGRNAENVFPTRDGTFQLPPKDDIKSQNSDRKFDSGDQFGDKDSTSTSFSSSGGESVKRQVRTVTSGSGPNAVTKVITTETRTGPDGQTHVTTSEKVVEGAGNESSDDQFGDGNSDRFGNFGSRFGGGRSDDHFGDGSSDRFGNFGSRFGGGRFDDHFGDGKSTDFSSSGGESVKRQVRTETIGSGPNAVTKTITTETRTGPDGQKHVTTTEKIVEGAGNQTSDYNVDKKFGALDMNEGDNAGPKQTEKEFNDDVVRMHNVYRRRHQVPDVVENEELTSLAQKWADHLSSINTLQHSNDKFNGQPIGENVAAKSGSGRVDYTGEEVVDQWYKESENFNYDQPEGVPGVKTGHFSQVVWKSSKEIGIGRAFSSDGRRAFVVCNYSPAGNYVGEYAANVLPPE